MPIVKTIIKKFLYNIHFKQKAKIQTRKNKTAKKVKQKIKTKLALKLSEKNKEVVAINK